MSEAPPGAAAPEDRDRWWLVPLIGWSVLILLLVYLGPVRAKLEQLGYPASNFWLRYISVTLLGCLVGYSEVVLRYRDEPLRAVAGVPGMAFVLLNGAVAVLALFLVEYFSTSAERGNVVQRVLLTGVGAMVILRGKLLTVPLPGGGQAELGFAPLVEAILASVNRSIDRERAYDRLKLVAPMAQRMAPLGYARLAPYFRVGLQSLQTLDPDILKAVVESIEALKSGTKFTDYTDCAKIEAIGFDLLNNFGKRCFEQVFLQAEASVMAEDAAAAAKAAKAGSIGNAVPPAAPAPGA